MEVDDDRRRDGETARSRTERDGGGAFCHHRHNCHHRPHRHHCHHRPYRHDHHDCPDPRHRHHRRNRDRHPTHQTNGDEMARLAEAGQAMKTQGKLCIRIYICICIFLCTLCNLYGIESVRGRKSKEDTK